MVPERDRKCPEGKVKKVEMKGVKAVGKDAGDLTMFETLTVVSPSVTVFFFVFSYKTMMQSSPSTCSLKVTFGNGLKF